MGQPTWMCLRSCALDHVLNVGHGEQQGGKQRETRTVLCAGCAGCWLQRAPLSWYPRKVRESYVTVTAQQLAGDDFQGESNGALSLCPRCFLSLTVCGLHSCCPLVFIGRLSSHHWTISAAASLHAIHLFLSISIVFLLILLLFSLVRRPVVAPVARPTTNI